MKTLNLWVNGEGWKPFEYNELKDIQAEFDKRGISIGDQASIGYEASIGWKASIGDQASILKSLFITGTKHPINFYGTGIIHIGCYKNTIEWWEKNYKQIGEKEQYSEAQIEEYFNYIQMCKMLK